MAREYTPDWYLERISWIKAAKRQISLSTDIIVGFPGETPEDFIQTMNLLAQVEYDVVFGFKYSGRPNTPASCPISIYEVHAGSWMRVPEEARLRKRLQKTASSIIFFARSAIGSLNFEAELAD